VGRHQVDASEQSTRSAACERPADILNGIRRDLICFSPYVYQSRNPVERLFNKIKQCRRITTQYDKLAANYPAFIKLASIRIWLGAYECTP
jgi:transposase